MKRLFISVFLISFILSNNLIAVEKDPITLDDIEKLGQIPKLNKLPDKMFEELKSCKPYNKKFTKCESQKAGKIVSETFRKKSNGEKYPGKMMHAMAYFEILYLSSLYKNQKEIEKFKKNFNKKNYNLKSHKSLRSLISMNDSRVKMRSALGMTLETSTEEAINKFWVLGEFLELGSPVEIGKLDKETKKRKKLLQKYKATLSKLNEKIEKEQKQ